MPDAINRKRGTQERDHRRRAAASKLVRGKDAKSIVEKQATTIPSLHDAIIEATEKAKARKLLTAGGERKPEEMTKTEKKDADRLKLVETIRPGKVTKNGTIRHATVINKKKVKNMLQKERLIGDISRLGFYFMYLINSIIGIFQSTTMTIDANWISTTFLPRCAVTIGIMGFHVILYYFWVSWLQTVTRTPTQSSLGESVHTSISSLELFSIGTRADGSSNKIQENYKFFRRSVAVYVTTAITSTFFYVFMVTWGDTGQFYPYYEQTLSVCWLYWVSLVVFIPLQIIPSNTYNKLPPNFIDTTLPIIILMTLISLAFAVRKRHKLRIDFMLAMISSQQRKLVQSEVARSERVLHSLFPTRIATKIKHFYGTYTEMHMLACVLSTDVVGYTALSSLLYPTDVIEILNIMFTLYDNLCERYSVEKVSTAGDGFIAFGFVDCTGDMAPLARMLSFSSVISNVCQVALEIQQRVMSSVNLLCAKQLQGNTLAVRAGIHTGHLYAGVITSSQNAHRAMS
eukprot:jgi/Hompol1/5075/HPOL_001297-RA